MPQRAGDDGLLTHTNSIEKYDFEKKSVAITFTVVVVVVVVNVVTKR